MLVMDACLQPQEGNTIMKPHDSHSKSVGLLLVLLYIDLENQNRISNLLRENRIELLILGIEPALE